MGIKRQREQMSGRMGCRCVGKRLYGRGYVKLKNVLMKEEEYDEIGRLE